MNKEILNCFKTKLKSEFKGLICGLNSYDYTHFSQIRLFIKENKKNAVLDKLNKNNYELDRIKFSDGGGFNLRHNADLIINVIYRF